MKEKQKIKAVKSSLKTSDSQLDRLSETHQSLEKIHDAPNEEDLFYNRQKIKSQVLAGFHCISQCKEEFMRLRDLIEKKRTLIFQTFIWRG